MMIVRNNDEPGEEGVVGAIVYADGCRWTKFDLAQFSRIRRICLNLTWKIR